MCPNGRALKLAQININPKPVLAYRHESIIKVFKFMMGYSNTKINKTGLSIEVILSNKIRYLKATDIKIQMKQTYTHVGMETEDVYYLLI